MLINCPKCGFSQPNDRYCAKCGVDMVAFRPHADPFWKQLLLSPLFLIGITAALVIASIVFIRQKQTEEITTRAQLIRNGPLIVDQSAQTNTQASSEYSSGETAQAEGSAAAANNNLNSPPPTLPTPVTPSPASGPQAAPQTAALTETGKDSAPEAALPQSPPSNSPTPAKTSPGSTSPAAAAGSKKETRTNLTAYFTDSHKQTLTMLHEESQTTGQFVDFGDYKSGPVLNIKSRLGRANRLNVLQSVEKNFDAKTREQKWFVGTKTTDSTDVGLTLLVVLEPEQPDGHTRGEIEILRSFYEGPEAEGGPTRKAYPVSSFDLQPDWDLMVQLNLPRADQSPMEDLAPEGFMKLFSLASFKKGDSEFTLFLDFDSREP